MIRFQDTPMQEDRKSRKHTKLFHLLNIAVFFAITLGLPNEALPAAPTLSGTTVYWSSTNVISSVKDTTASLGATIDADGGAAITERGVVWSTTDNTPTIGEPGVTKFIEGSTGTGTFSASVTALTEASLIYFSGYAINSLTDTGYSPVSSFYTEPDTAPAPTVNAPSGINYFDLTVNYTKPANADGVLVVARQTLPLSTPPYDGLEYTANARIGDGDSTEPGCIIFCENVVAKDTASGSVNVTGLKDNSNYYFTVYAYKGSGAGITGINYVQTVTAAGPVTTDTVPVGGKSHNELHVAQGGAGGAMTSADCANCHGVHHTAQLLPTGIDMYNKCFTCHQAGGAADPKINIGLHLADGSVDCGTCHSMHSFKEEELYSTDHLGIDGFNRSFVRANMAKYLNTGNGFAVDALEPTVFQVRPGDFAYASGDTPYNAVCQTCHSDDSKTSHHQQDATDDHNFGSDCMTCHPHKNKDQYNAFKPGHDDSQFAPEALCTDCHNGGIDVIGTIHTRCGLCHVKAAGSGPLHGSAAGKTLTPARSCTYCHSSIADHATKVVFHHATDTALLGHCETCHDGTTAVDTATAPTQLSCVRCHVEYTGSDMQIITFDLTRQNAANPTDSRVVGTVAGHTFTFGTGPATEIYDFRACFDCHSGLNTNYPVGTYPNIIVKPFHAYPGDWTKGFLYAGAGQLPGLGSATPAAYANGLNDVTPATFNAANPTPTASDATQIPYLYQWYHPGPALMWSDTSGNIFPNTNYPGVRRFSLAMANRNSAATTNKKIYNHKTGIQNPNTTPANTQGVYDFGKPGNVMTMVPGGETLGRGIRNTVTEGDSVQNPLYSQSITVPYTGGRGWGGGDATAPFTTVPTWPDITGGDVIDIIKAEYDGSDLVVWATNNLDSGATLSIPSYSGDVSCTGNMTWVTDHHEYTCVGTTYTVGDTVTVRSNAAASLDVTVPVNN